MGSPKRINLSFDEWNVWSIEKHQAHGRLKDWPVAPRIIEDEYTVADGDAGATNTEANPSRVVPKPLEDVTLEGGSLCAVLPPVSWTMVRLSCS
jgi:alpha-L-arabinofuranosidase